MLCALGPARLLVQHTFLYYTLTCTTHIFTCTAHICLLYKDTYVYSLIMEYNTTNFSISNMVSGHFYDIFLTVLSLLVLLHSQHRFHHHNSRCSLLPLNLRRLPVVVFGFGPTTAIVEESYTAQTIACVIIAVNITSITFLQVSLRSSCTNLHVGGSLAVIEDRTCCPKLLRQIPCTPHVVLSSS